MSAKFRFVACFIVVALALTSADGGSSLKDQLRFGVEAAKSGLWREARFRWEKYLEQRPDNARIHNNLAVAYEGLGDFERAGREYKEALRIDPDSKEIKANYESFQELLDLLQARSATAGDGDE